jgi:hypothetical protein
MAKAVIHVNKHQRHRAEGGKGWGETRRAYYTCTSLGGKVISPEYHQHIIEKQAHGFGCIYG